MRDSYIDYIQAIVVAVSSIERNVILEEGKV